MSRQSVWIRMLKMHVILRKIFQKSLFIWSKWSMKSKIRQFELWRIRRWTILSWLERLIGWLILIGSRLHMLKMYFSIRTQKRYCQVLINVWQWHRLKKALFLWLSSNKGMPLSLILKVFYHFLPLFPTVKLFIQKESARQVRLAHYKFLKMI